ncbi:MAG TPA: enoyl-CoA hydratase/isomerase family protein [Cyclobacteriaceae bacterium]
MGIIKTDVKDRKYYITLNRPEKRNALNPNLVKSLSSAFKAARDDENVKVIILKAEGKAFCAGADLNYIQSLQDYTLEENLEDSNNLRDLFYLVYSSLKPVIAQVQGHAIAGGCGLASICDFIFAVPEAKFGYTEVRIGFIPALVTVFLSRKIGEGHAKELLLTGELKTSTEVLRLGLINKVIDSEKLEESVEDFADVLIKSNSLAAMQLTKKLILEVKDMDINKGLDYAAQINAQARSTFDCKEGIAAFLEKRAPIWE